MCTDQSVLGYLSVLDSILKLKAKRGVDTDSIATSAGPTKCGIGHVEFVTAACFSSATCLFRQDLGQRYSKMVVVTVLIIQMISWPS